MFSEVDKFHWFAALRGVVNGAYVVDGQYCYLRCHAYARAEAVFELFHGIGGCRLLESYLEQHVVGTGVVGRDLYDVVLHVLGVVEHVVDSRRVERGAFKLYHVVFAPYERCEAVGVATTRARVDALSGYVACAETQQRHTLHAEGGNHYLAGLPVGHRQVVVAYYLDNDKLGMHMAAKAIGALTEGGAHLGRGIGGEELHFGPLVVDALSQQIEREILLAQALANAYDTFHRAAVVVDAVILGILYQLEYERRHTHHRVGLYALNGVPLQLGYAVAHANDRGAHLAETEKIGEAGHETLVEGGHKLHYVARAQARTLKRLLLVVGQALQVLLGAGKGNGVAKGAGGCDIVDNLVLRAAEEVVVEKLEVFLLGEGNLHKVVEGCYLVDIYAVALEKPLVVGRMLRKVAQGLVEALLLVSLYLGRGGEFYIFNYI